MTISMTINGNTNSSVIPSNNMGLRDWVASFQPNDTATQGILSFSTVELEQVHNFISLLVKSIKHLNVGLRPTDNARNYIVVETIRTLVNNTTLNSYIRGYYRNVTFELAPLEPAEALDAHSKVNFKVNIAFNCPNHAACATMIRLKNMMEWAHLNTTAVKLTSSKPLKFETFEAISKFRLPALVPTARPETHAQVVT